MIKKDDTSVEFLTGLTGEIERFDGYYFVDLCSVDGAIDTATVGRARTKGAAIRNAIKTLERSLAELRKMETTV